MRCSFALAVVAGVTLSASAANWKPQSTADLKADLVRFARANGQAAFADRIERQTDSTEWIDEAIRFGERILSSCVQASFDDPRRRTALELIDFPLHVDTCGKATPKEVEAYRCAIVDCLVRGRRRVLKDVKSSRVEQGQLRVWHLYNMAYVLKGCSHTVLLDLTPNPFGEIWSDADWRDYAEVADVLVVTHPHGDHVSYPLMRQMVSLGKPMVLPCALKDPDTGVDYSKSAGVVVLDRDCFAPIEIAGVKFWSLRGYQVDPSMDCPCNVYLMEVDGVRVADNGDNSPSKIYSGLLKCPPADVIISSTWNFVTKFVGRCMEVPGFLPERAVFLPSHENELTHRVAQRESYREMYADPQRLAAPGFRWPRVLPLWWGESFHFPGSGVLK